MTDNRTTELLREGLTERGIEWRSWLEGVTIVGDWCFVEYDSGKLAAACEPVLTPEQAIAAALGNGTLTAEQVREAIEKRFDFDVWVPPERWQAIADELNAEIGGTCENASELNTDGVAGYHFTCSECGLSVCASMGVGEIELSGPRSFHWKVDGKYEFERCQRCGRKVKR